MQQIIINTFPLSKEYNGPQPPYEGHRQSVKPAMIVIDILPLIPLI